MKSITELLTGLHDAGALKMVEGDFKVPGQLVMLFVYSVVIFFVVNVLVN